MASRFETFSEGEVCAINEEVVHSNTKKATKLWLVGVHWWEENYFHAEFAKKIVKCTCENPRNVCKL